MRRLLILVGHPRPTASTVSTPLARRAAALDGVTVVDLYAEYPRYDINVDREQARLLEHDVIVFQCPFYWYSTPAILKEWQDLVLEHGWAYGSGGDRLHGKLFFAALSAGGPVDAYGPNGRNKYSVPELLAPLERTAALCGMRWLPPFVLHGAISARKDDRIGRHAEAYVRLLTALRDDTLDLDAAEAAPRLDLFMAEG